MILEQICLEEMNSLLTCFKDKDFNQNFCLNEINQFKDCYSSYMVKYNLTKSLY